MTAIISTITRIANASCGLISIPKVVVKAINNTGHQLVAAHGSVLLLVELKTSNFTKGAANTLSRGIIGAKSSLACTASVACQALAFSSYSVAAALAGALGVEVRLALIGGDRVVRVDGASSVPCYRRENLILRKNGPLSADKTAISIKTEDAVVVKIASRYVGESELNRARSHAAIVTYPPRITLALILGVASTVPGAGIGTMRIDSGNSNDSKKRSTSGELHFTWNALLNPKTGTPEASIVEMTELRGSQRERLGRKAKTGLKCRLMGFRLRSR